MPDVREPTHGWAEHKLEGAHADPLLPDPEPRERSYTIISVDDHLVEPRDLFEGRMPTAMVEAAPRVIENDLGQELWLYEDMLYPQIGLNAIVGRPKDQWNTDPARFDEMRKGMNSVSFRRAKTRMPISESFCLSPSTPDKHFNSAFNTTVATRCAT